MADDIYVNTYSYCLMLMQKCDSEWLSDMEPIKPSIKNPLLANLSVDCIGEDGKVRF